MIGINFILNTPPYPCEIMISIGQSETDLVKSIKKWPGMSDIHKLRLVEGVEDDDKRDFDGILHRLHSAGCGLIRVPKLTSTPKDHGILAHEIFHAVEFVAHHVELKHCEKSSEAFAYLISYLTTEVYKRLK